MSLDGSKPKYHDVIRASQGSFERAIGKIELLRRHGIGFTIAAVATALNYSCAHRVPGYRPPNTRFFELIFIFQEWGK